MILETFIKWEEEIHPVIAHVSGLLGEKLSSEPEEMIKDLLEIESWSGLIGTHLASADSYLDKAEAELKPSREEGTDFDRRLILDGKVSTVRLVRDTLESLSESIKQRISMAQSILSYQRQFIEPKIMKRGGNDAAPF